jgi:hypothetical protein
MLFVLNKKDRMIYLTIYLYLLNNVTLFYRKQKEIALFISSCFSVIMKNLH